MKILLPAAPSIENVRRNRRMNKNIRIGLAGTGYWGKNLLRNLRELGALAALCDSDDTARDHFAELYPGVATFAEFDMMLKDESIDAVMIATPAATHGELVARALDARKHVFVEKPLCLDIDEAENLRQRAEELGVTLMVGHLLHYHPAFVAIKDLVQSGGLGPLRYIYSNRLSTGKIRREESALWSFAPHDISMILSLVDEMPTAINANGGHYLNAAIADTTLSHMTFKNGVQAHIFVSWLHPYKDHRLVVVGEKAMAVFDDTKSGADKVLLFNHDLRWEGEEAVVNKADAKPVPYGDEEPLKLECQAFIDAVANGTTVPSNAVEGVRVLRVLDACQRALQSGERVET